jgi:hypothetical protein
MKYDGTDAQCPVQGDHIHVLGVMELHVPGGHEQGDAVSKMGHANDAEDFVQMVGVFLGCEFVGIF